MAQTKNIHIVDLSKNLMDRLQTVKLSPNYVLSKSVDINSIKKIYPRIQPVNKRRVDLILEVVEFSSERKLTEQLRLWRGDIKPGGLLLFCVVNFEIDMQKIGDILLGLGFLDVVIDCEEGVAYGHAIGPMEARIEISQIRRMN